MLSGTMADNHSFSKHILGEKVLHNIERNGSMINWKVRFKNRKWVMSFIAQLLIVSQMVIGALNSLGVIDFQLTDAIQNSIITFANSVLILLSMLGIVQDPTTKGYRDSERAKQYTEPN